MTTSEIITICIFVAGLVIQGFVSYWKNKQTVQSAINTVEKNLTEEISKTNNMVTMETAVIKTRLQYLEEKQDKHNSLIERMIGVEQSMKSAHHRIDDLCDEIKHFRKEGKEG